MSIKYYNWYYFMEVILVELWTSKIVILVSDHWNKGQIHSPGGRSSHTFFNNWKKKQVESGKGIEDINNVNHRPTLINIVSIASSKRKLSPIMPETMFFSSTHKIFNTLVLCWAIKKITQSIFSYPCGNQPKISWNHRIGTE